MGELTDALAAELASSRLTPDEDFIGYKPPKGWETPIRVGPDGGWITTGWRNTEPTRSEWDAMLTEWDVDTDRYEVDDTTPPEFIGWNGQTTEYDTDGRKVTGVTKLRRFKCRLRLRRSAAHAADIDTLCALVAKRRPRKPATSTRDGVGLVVALGDWQLGKGAGGGTPATVNYLMGVLDEVESRVRAAKPSVLYLAGMGDKVEGCTGFYPSQPATIDANQIEQERLARHIQLAFIDRLAASVPVLKVSEAASNHGENRNSKGPVTDPVRDNRDMALHEQVADVLSRNPERYGHVSMLAPSRNDPLVTLADVAGVPVAVTHGHQIRGARPRISEWWKGQMGSALPVAEAQILLLGHRHHFAMSEEIGRTWVQVPASDGGSEWFAASTGHRSPRGVVVMTVGAAFGPRGWGSLDVIGGDAKVVDGASSD